MRAIDVVIDALIDGQEHYFEQVRLATTADLNETQLEMVLRFLESYGFVYAYWNVPGRPVRLAGCMLTFLKKLNEAT